jgi:hypothetical protein
MDFQKVSRLYRVCRGRAENRRKHAASPSAHPPFVAALKPFRKPSPRAARNGARYASLPGAAAEPVVQLMASQERIG